LVLGLVNVIATYVARLGGRIGPDEFAMGWGDPLLLGAMGAVLGWRALPFVVFLASAQGALVGLVLTVIGRMPAAAQAARRAERLERGEDDDAWVPPASAMPFGPFLALAGLEVAFYGGTLAALF
jgi:leader peptidase (prepilin peptidase)/N-methyltransferase